MKPAKDKNRDYKQLVANGYDSCAMEYTTARQEGEFDSRLLSDRLVAGATVLDIGCGPGVPIAKALAEKFKVTGVDISAECIRLARENVQSGTFIHGDIMQQHFPRETFDAVVVFYALFHLPREEHSELIKLIYHWLKPGGLSLMTVTMRSEESYTEDDFFGTTMFWSNYSLDDYKQMLEDAGFSIVMTEMIGHGFGSDPLAKVEVHPLILSQKSKD